MNQYLELHPADNAIVCTEDLFVLIEEDEHSAGHTGYTYAFADTKAGIRALEHVSGLMEQEDSYDLELWIDAMADVFGVDMVWAPIVHNDRITFNAVAWA